MTGGAFAFWASALRLGFRYGPGLRGIFQVFDAGCAGHLPSLPSFGYMAGLNLRGV